MKPQKRKPLSRERVLKAALALADKDGIAALSMRTLAAKLGVEAMSLYKHVANKEAVLDGLVDIVLEEIVIPPCETPWREAMRLRALSARRAILRHPWASVLIESRTTPSEARMRYGNEVFGFLRRAGFRVETAYRAFLTLDSYIYGFVIQEVNWPHKQSQRRMVIAGLKSFIREGSYPYLIELLGHVASLAAMPGGDSDYDREFIFGLDLLLDSLERTANA